MEVSIICTGSKDLNRELGTTIGPKGQEKEDSEEDPSGAFKVMGNPGEVRGCQGRLMRL